MTKTPNLNLELPAFNDSPWHDDVNDNFSAIDATINSVLGLTGLLGAYKNSTAVVLGNRYFDSATGFYYEAQSAFTTEASPTTFAQERVTYPARWALINATEAINAAADALASANLALGYKNDAEAAADAVVGSAATSLLSRFPTASSGALADLDDAVTTGVYAVSSSISANAPDFVELGSYDATLFVQAANNQLTQTIVTTVGRIYTRIDDTGVGDTWSAWARIWTDITIQQQSIVRDRITIIVSADWQAVPETPADITALEALFTGIETYHPGADALFVNGDISDRASDDGTGADTTYNYPEIWKSFKEKVPSISINRVIPLPGNHDREGNGLGSHQYAWTYKTYETHHGDGFYAKEIGNILFIGLGDMAGSVGGEILTPVLEWFEDLVRKNQDKNIVLNLHQPLVGTHDSFSEERWFQRPAVSTRITDILDTYPNIAFVNFGHVGSSYAQSTATKVLHGTTHINSQIGIPTLGPSDKLFYRFAELLHGATSTTIQVMNVTDGVVDGAKDVVITWEHKLDVGDGIIRDCRVPKPHKGTHRIFNTMEDYRNPTSPWAITPGIRWLQTIETIDAALNDIGAGEGVGVLFKGPGTTSDADAQGWLSTADPGSGVIGGVAAVRTTGTEEDFTSKIQIYSAGSGVDEASLVLAGEFNPDGTFVAVNGVVPDYVSAWTEIDIATAPAAGTDFVHNLDLPDPYIMDIEVWFYPGTGTRVFLWSGSSPIADQGSNRYDGSVSVKDGDTITIGVGNTGVFSEDNVDTGTTTTYTKGDFLVVAYKRPGMPALPT